MSGLSLVPEPSAGRGENPTPEAGRLRELGPMGLAGRPMEAVPPPSISSQEAAQIVQYLQRQTDATMLRFVQFLEEVETRDKLRTDAILTMQAQSDEALKKVSALLNKAGLSIKTIESDAGSSITRLEQATVKVGNLEKALKNYGDELGAAMRAQLKESAREASEKMEFNQNVHFNKVFTWLWITLGVFVVVMAGTLLLFWPSPAPTTPQSSTQEQQTTPAPRLKPKPLQP